MIPAFPAAWPILAVLIRREIAALAARLAYRIGGIGNPGGSSAPDPTCSRCGGSAPDPTFVGEAGGRTLATCCDRCARPALLRA